MVCRVVVVRRVVDRSVSTVVGVVIGSLSLGESSLIPDSSEGPVSDEFELGPPVLKDSASAVSDASESSDPSAPPAPNLSSSESCSELCAESCAEFCAESCSESCSGVDCWPGMGRGLRSDAELSVASPSSA